MTAGEAGALMASEVLALATVDLVRNPDAVAAAQSERAPASPASS